MFLDFGATCANVPEAMLSDVKSVLFGELSNSCREYCWRTYFGCFKSELRSEIVRTDPKQSVVEFLCTFEQDLLELRSGIAAIWSFELVLSEVATPFLLMNGFNGRYK